MSFPHQLIDKKWQTIWEKNKAFVAEDFSEKPKFYALDMFPYPSGSGLHVGHMASYTPTDVVARYKRQKGFNVLHPIGYDAFGLPAEQYAIQTGIHPAEITKKSISTFRRQLKSFGFSFDWTREVSTCDPHFYKWTQFIFLHFLEKGMAYQKEASVNWCPTLQTVLANEEVINGKSERGGHPVVRKPMKQWTLGITQYADRLWKDLDKVQWPQSTKEAQKNWIGPSQGVELHFKVKHESQTLCVFTTRPDTLFGVTFMVLSPEHPLIPSLLKNKPCKDVSTYLEKSLQPCEKENQHNLEKTGVFSGAHALHPITGKELPIWISDYVLMDYGTGAIMAVPGHDERDFNFAKTFKLPILRIFQDDQELPSPGQGPLCRSQFLDGLGKKEALSKITNYLVKKNIGKKVRNYRLRDWIFSRQRYWGEPFPIVHKQGQVEPVEELPVVLPEVQGFKPSKTGESPLFQNKEWLTHLGGQRETDTMPGSAGSSWYFLRYTDPHNPVALADLKKQQYWMPVDLYVGGAEHTVGHLLYARFFQKFLHGAGLATTDEPFLKVAHQGMILGSDGEKMSKSRGNVVNPDDVRAEFGADTLRCFILFLGPMDRDKPWNPKGIQGVRRFLERVWRLCVSKEGDFLGRKESCSPRLTKKLHKTIYKVTCDIESLDFNTAISALMDFVNEIYREKSSSSLLLKNLILILAPFAPHMCEEIWEIMGEKGFVSLASWPQWENQYLEEDTFQIAVQVDGKKRGLIQVDKNTNSQKALSLAREIQSVHQALGDKRIKKIIYRPEKVLNLLTDQG